MNARLAENLIPGGATPRQITTDTSTDGATARIASRAIDDDPNTYSCTTAIENPWWAVDLGSVKDVGTVVITFPDVNDDRQRNYHRPCFIQLIIHERVNSLNGLVKKIRTVIFCLGFCYRSQTLITICARNVMR